MNKKLFIFTEGGPGIGLGHFARCSALYEEAQKQGMEVQFIVNKAAEGLEILAKKNVVFSDWQSVDVISGFDVKGSYCIVDSYIAGPDVYKYISKESKRALYFDDENRLVYPEGILLNAQVTNKYQDIESLLGVECALVREDFFKHKKIETREQVNDVLVSLGADLHKLTPRIAGILSQHFSDAVIHFAKGLSAENMAKLIARCDLGVIAASQTALEFCAVGTPFVCIKTAANQNLTWLVENDIIREGISWDNLNLDEKILAQVKELSSYNAREQKRVLLQSIIHADSAERIIRRLTR